MPDIHKFDELRHPEVEAYWDSAETPTALISVGTTEQHGDHLAMGTDAFIPTEICERIAEDVDALVSPPMNYGASDMHAGYEGITYLTYRTLATVVHDIAYSLAESGFTDIVFISGHLTNDWAAKVGANQATHDLPEEHYVYAFPYWDALSGEDMEEYLSFDSGWHANIGETAAVMAIDEGLGSYGVNGGFNHPYEPSRYDCRPDMTWSIRDGLREAFDGQKMVKVL